MLKKILQTKQRGKNIHRRSNNNKDNIHIYIPLLLHHTPQRLERISTQEPAVAAILLLLLLL
jgi:hypothetical protein